MIDVDVAELIELYARQVEQLPGVSRTKPEAFVEAKSELAGTMREQARQLRTVSSRAARLAAGLIVPGTRMIKQRQVRVEVRVERRSA